MPVIMQSLCNILRKHWNSILEDGDILMILEYQGKENISFYGVRNFCSTEINMHLPATLIERDRDLFIYSCPHPVTLELEPIFTRFFNIRN